MDSRPTPLHPRHLGFVPFRTHTEVNIRQQASDAMTGAAGRALDDTANKASQASHLPRRPITLDPQLSNLSHIAPNRRPLPQIIPLEPLQSSFSSTPEPWQPPIEQQQMPPKLRPLSDIRELTEPSLIDAGLYRIDLARKSSLKRSNSLRNQTSPSRKPSLVRKGSQHSTTGKRAMMETEAEIEASGSGKTLHPESQSDGSSTYSLSLENVPSRSMSRSRSRQRPRERSVNSLHQAGKGKAPALPPPRGHGFTIPNRGRSQSPIKSHQRHETVYSSGLQSCGRHRTFIRTTDPNVDVLDFPAHRHPRLTLELQISSSLFVGGSSIEGCVRVIVADVDRAKSKRQMALSRISIDLLGVEEMSGTKRTVFINLATELVGAHTPPPETMVESLRQHADDDPFWPLAPSTTTVPYVLSLPLDVGPPPFASKHARIQYILAATVLIRDQGKQYLVRSSQEISVISVFDPEKALMSLPTPMTVSDECLRSKAPVETIKATAGLHRQIWVSGTSIFVDVQIANKSKKGVKRLELQLERDILCYKHTAATLDTVINNARVFDWNEKSILSKNILKASTSGWSGVSALSTELRTFELEVPRGHATIQCGKYFEVRFFLNVVIGTSSRSKLITLQLPIVLIHMNSVDVVPNSIAQVAAAIEEKRAHVCKHSKSSHQRSRHGSVSSVQGRAFAAPRKHSLDRTQAEMAELGKVLQRSPRKYRNEPQREIPGALRSKISRNGEGSTSSLVKQVSFKRDRSETKLSISRPMPARDIFADAATRSRVSEETIRDASSTLVRSTSLRKDATVASDLRPVDPRPKTIEEARERLRKMRSRELSRSNASLQQLTAVPDVPPKERFYREQISIRPSALSPVASIESSDNDNVPSLGKQFRRMKSAERWRAPGGWFHAEKGKEKSRDYGNSRPVSNWV